MTRKIWWSIISVLGLSIILMLSQLIHIPVLTVSEQQEKKYYNTLVPWPGL